MRHTRYGFWLEEAGLVEPAPPLTGDTTADVVIVGAGYLGLWTAWQLKALEPALDVVVLDAGLAGHGPSGRNGGFVSTLWDDLPILRDRVGDMRAVEVCRASERAVHGIGAWCEAQGVDAWYRAGGTIQVATSAVQLGDWDEVVAACREVGAPGEAVALSREDVAARCASPAFLAGMFLQTAASVQPARLSLGPSGEGDRGRRSRSRAHAGADIVTRGNCGDTERHGAGASRRAGCEHGHRRVRRLSPCTRRRLEPHGGHRARARRDRGDRVDGR